MGGGGFSAFLQALAGQLVGRRWFKFIIRNGKDIFEWWLIFTGLMWSFLLGWGAYDWPLGDWWVEKFRGWDRFYPWYVTAFWTLVYAVGLPLVPLALAALPFIALGVVLWAALYFIGGFILLAAGPFIILAGLRGVFFHYAAKSLAEADNRAKEERSVMAALGMGDAPERSLEGKARLMGPEEVAKYNAKPKRGALTLVGSVGGKAFANWTEKHVLIVAGTRGGKGRDLIIPNLCRYKGSVFVLDPKGENAQRSHEYRHDTVFTLDPFGVSGLPSSRFNPLRYLAGDSMITDAQTFADALIVGDDYFSNSARQLLTGLILYVVAEPDLTIPSDGKKPDTSPAPDDVKLLTGRIGISRDLITVRRLLMRGLEKTLENMVKSKAEPFAVREIIRDIGEWGNATSDKEWSGIRNSAIEQTKWLNSPEFRAVLEEGDGTNQIDFSDYLKGLMSVYVCLPAPYFATFNRWLRLVVAAALDTMTKRLAPPERPVRFVLDEVAQLGNLAKIESSLTLSAGYGVQLWGIWQHIKDIERCYPSSGVGGWVSSSGLRLVFAVQDNETIRYFAAATGEALTETDIRHLPPGKILCMMDGENPVLVDRWIEKEEQEAQAGAQAA
jgi:type IV secretion system protein VirD4